MASQPFTRPLHKLAGRGNALLGVNSALAPSYRDEPVQRHSSRECSLTCRQKFAAIMLSQLRA